MRDDTLAALLTPSFFYIMTRRQTDYIRMADAVLSLLDQHPAAWENNDPFINSVEALRTARAAASEAGVGQRAGSGGVTQERDDLADVAIEQVLRLAGFAQAYALDKHDKVLYERMRVRESALDRMPDNELQDALTDISQRIAALPAAAVAPYGLTGKAQESLAKAVAAHKDALGTPRATIAERKVHTDAVKTAMKQMRVTFKKMDRLAPLFDTDAPDFVSAYKTARIVIPTGSRGSKPDAPDAPKD